MGNLPEGRMTRTRPARSLLFLAVLLANPGAWAESSAQDLGLTDQVIERTLDNGLTVLMVVRPETPLIRCILAYRVGSVNERPGITGISHFHEHMMFKGSNSMGVKPGMLERDRQIMAQIDEIMARIIEEEGKIHGRDDARIIEWKAQIADLIAYYDQALGDGSISGVGKGRSGPNKARALGNQLRSAQQMIADGEWSMAIDQLYDVLKHADGTGRPKDFVEGLGLTELQTRIMDLIAGLGG